MKMFFFITLCVSILALIGCGQFHPIDTNSQLVNKFEKEKFEYPNFKLQADEFEKSLIKYDAAKIAYFIHPLVKEQFGDEKKFLEFIEKGYLQTKPGWKQEKQTVGEITQIQKIDNELFVVAPIQVIIKTPNGRLVGESSLVGISSDDGANWKFTSPASQEWFKQIFPKAAEKIQIPAEEPPKLIEN